MKCAISRIAKSLVPFFVGLFAANMILTHATAQEGDVRRVHDPCIIKAGDWYYVFSTLGCIKIRRSNDLVHWNYVGEALRAARRA